MIKHLIALLTLLLWAGVFMAGPIAQAQDAPPENVKTRALGPLAYKVDARLIPALKAVHAGTATDKSAARDIKSRHGAALASTPQPEQLSIRIDAIINKGLLAQIAGTGALVTHSAPQWNTVSVTATASQIDALSQIGGIRTITLQAARRKRQQGSTGNAADTQMHADQVRAAGFTGKNQKIGVMSDSVIDTPSVDGNSLAISGTQPNATVTGTVPQGTLDLPPSFQLVDQGPGGGQDEGEAMMELIYDIAPGSALAFASSGNTQTSMASNLLALQAANCNITVDDVGFGDEPVFQDGPIAQAITTNAGKGVVHFSAFGNDGSNGILQTYKPIASNTTDDMVDPPSGNDFHNWGIAGTTPDFLPISLSAGDNLTVVMEWNQPYSSYNLGAGSQADLDLYLYSSNAVSNNPLASATDPQGTTGAPSNDPIETLNYTNQGNNTTVVYLAVNHFHGVRNNVMWLVISDTNQDMAFPSGGVNGPTGSGHPSSTNCVGVAAMPTQSIGSLSAEPFSSEGGGIPYYFDTSGNLLPNAPVLRAAPDLSAPDGVNTSMSNYAPFFGTSCAAPNAAAVAALLLQAAPGSSQSTLITAMKTSASSATPTNRPDPFTGWGLVNAFAAYKSLVQTPANISIASSLNASTYGQAVSFTATLSGVLGTPTGMVQFQIDGVNFGSAAPVSSGSASSGALTTLTAGNHTIGAIYSGDTNYLGSKGTLTQTVNKAATSSSVTSSGISFVYGQNVTFTAKIAITAPGAGTPTGTVTFVDGQISLGSVAVSAGSAALTTQTLTAGSHTISAVYNGDNNFSGSTGTVSQQITQAATTITLTSSVNPSVSGQQIGFTAMLSATAPGRGIPTGTVTFNNGSNTLGTGTLSAGSAVLSIGLPVGGYSISAVYAGDINFTGSTTTVLTQTVTQASSSLGISSPANPSALNQPVAFIATVSPVAPAGGVATGTVQFQLDGANFGAAVALSNGAASSPSISTLSLGLHNIQAAYSGDVNFKVSSGTLTQTVNPFGPPSLFIVTGFPSPSVAGTGGSFSATIQDGFGNTVTNYTGTVNFSSTDVQAVLPSGYTFLASDKGTKTFSAILKTAGSQALTLTDKAANSITGSQSGIMVTPAATSQLLVSGFPSPTIVNVAGNFSVTAQDPFGNTTPIYTGTIHFTSSDTTASLPGDYTFAPGDNGTKTFSATFNTLSTQMQSLAATDTKTASIHGIQTISAVNPPAPVITSALNVSGILGSPLTYTITATNTPTLFNATGLPSWLNFNSATGVLSGTPTTPDEIGVASISISAGNVTGTATATVSVAIASAPAQFTSPPSGSATEALPGSPVTFSAPVGLGVTVSWNFGDGTVDNSNSSTLIHTFTAVGIYSVVVTVTDSSGNKTSSVIPITIVGSQAEIDSDGNGFPDQLKSALGVSLTDPSATPFGIPGPVIPKALGSLKVAIKLNFTRFNSDSIAVSGILPVPAGFISAGTSAAVDVGGVVQGFVLDKRGRGKAGVNTFSCTIPKKGGNGKFQAKFTRSTYSGILADSGLTGTDDVSNQPVTVVIYVIFNQTLYKTAQPLTYQAKAGRTGSAK